MVGEAKIARLNQLTLKAHGLLLVVDNLTNLADLVDGASGAGKGLDVLVNVDVGMGRTGLHQIPRVVDLARAAHRAEGLTYKGIQGYSGMVQHINALAERETVYGAQLDHLSAVVDALKAEDLAPEIISDGGTGTSIIDGARGLFS